MANRDQHRGDPRAGAERERAQATPRFHLAEVAVDPARLRIVGPRGERHVEPRVMDVLTVLAARAPQPASRDELMDAVWGQTVVTDGVLSRCISILRDHLDDDRAAPRFIETLSKRGYRLLPPVRFVEETAPAPDRAAAMAPDDTPATVSLAVLPFVNLAGDAADEHIADGLTELMIANLAGVSSLRVIARTSSMIFKGTHKRLREIAADLNVDYAVEGSMLRDGGRMQVVVQLIEARSEMPAWTHTYTRELRDLLTLLNEIARTVASAVSTRLKPAETVRLSRRIEIGEVALQHYLKGRFFWAQRGADSLPRASAEFVACTRLAPDFAPAFGGLADCQILLAIYGIERPTRAAELAREYHALALALDPESAEVQTALGALRLFFDWNLADAEPAFVCALALNPSYTTAYLSYGDLLMMRGEFDRGLRLIRQAVRLSPFDLGLNMNVGDFLIFSRHFDEAVGHLEHTLEMDGRFVAGRLRLAEALALAGRGEAALAQMERAYAAASMQPRVRETRAFVLAASGKHRQARDELAALEAERSRRYVSAWEIARAYAVMGDADDAIAWLQAAIDERAPMTLFAGVHAALDPIRHDPRFAGVLLRIGSLPLRAAAAALE